VDRLGLVVHPTRSVDSALERIAAWASAHDVRVGQVVVAGQERRVADPVDPAACDLLLALGGDGTTLAALHAGAPNGRPVLGVACGSIGVLTAVAGDRVAWALEQVADGRSTPASVPGLDIAWDGTHRGVAVNDVAVLRGGAGQILISVAVDDVLYARVAGDGVVLATALGSSAYTMAAGGPVLAPRAEGIVVTPLAPHGGSVPPLVAAKEAHVTLTVDAGRGGSRCEIDGRPATVEGTVLTVRERSNYATLAVLAEQEPRLTGLRRRGLVTDSPRLVVREARR
jgi:NAD+ kinase